MMVVMVLVVEMMMMMITMKSSSMTVTMAMIPPSLGRDFPDRFLSARELFSLWCFSALQRRQNISLVAP